MTHTPVENFLHTPGKAALASPLQVVDTYGLAEPDPWRLLE